MYVEKEAGSANLLVQDQQPGGQEMVQRERWEEIRRLHFGERVSIREIARRLNLDRKTVRRCVRESEWKPLSACCPAGYAAA